VAMGFSDRKNNAKALNRANGDLEEAIIILTTELSQNPINFNPQENSSDSNNIRKEENIN
jgi:hypothetical protein